MQPHVSNCNEVEARANNYENKGSLGTYFKNSFAWLMGIKKLIFDYSNFFGSGHFSIHQIWKMGQKRTRAKISKVLKITLFMLVDLTNEFLKYVLYLQTFLRGLLPHCNWTYMASEKNYLISSISFDMSYLKITFQTQFSGTSNTLVSMCR